MICCSLVSPVNSKPEKKHTSVKQDICEMKGILRFCKARVSLALYKGVKSQFELICAKLNINSSLAHFLSFSPKTNDKFTLFT